MKSIYFLPLLIFGSLFFENRPVEASIKLCNEKTLSTKKIVSSYKPNVVVVNAADSTGSGFVIGHSTNKTFIITNKHVVDSNKKVSVKWSDNSTDKGIVIKSATNSEAWKKGIFVNDMALIRIEGIKGNPLPIKLENELSGEDVIAIGTPAGYDFTVTRGIVSAVRDQGQIIQTDAAINLGNSGGPLINSSGCVVGINTYIYRTEEGYQGLNFAVSSSRILKFLENSGYGFLQNNLNNNFIAETDQNNLKNLENKEDPYQNTFLGNRNIFKKKSKIKTYGAYSVDLNNVDIDRIYFENYQEISFTTSFKKNGYKSDKTLDIICGAYEGDHLRFSWEDNSWKRTQFNSDERYMLKAICKKMMNSQRLFSFLESKDWERYGKSSWVNTNGWKQWEGNNADFYTNYYDPNHSENSTVNTISVNCKAKSISFLVFNFGGDDYWNNWVSLPDPYDQIVYDKCN